MPALYEEAAHLLFAILSHGLAVTPGTDHRLVLSRLALRLERVLADRLTHADAAIAILDELQDKNLAAFDARSRDRLVAVLGTLICNLIAACGLAARR